MAEISYPIAGGAGVNEYTYELLMSQVMGSGRIEMYNSEATDAPPMIYADSTGRQYKIVANAAYLVRGYRWESGADGLVKPLEPNTSGMPRVDRAVLRLNRADYTVRLDTLKGVPSTSPVPPTPTTTTAGSTGVYEIPIGRITVKSQSGTNLPAIAGTDVQPEHRWLMPHGQYGYSTFRGATNGIGKLFLEHDTGRLYCGAPGGDILIGENGPRTKIAVAGGWTSDDIYAQRVNGTTHFQAHAVLNVADRAPATDLALCVLPPQFRPQNDRWLRVSMSPGQVAFGYITAATGAVAITAYPQTFPKGGRVILGPESWPSTGVKS